MLILIAESKTMREEEMSVSRETFLKHTPTGEAAADEIMVRLLNMNVEEIISLMKVSRPMATRIAKMAYEFPNKSAGLEAIEAFTGVVFKNLEYEKFSSDERDFVADHVRIISSLYGWLRPRDIIKPYRCEYTAPLSPDDKPLSTYWKKDVTIRLVKDLQASGETDILNLLPADAAKCVDWKLMKRFAKVWKVDFKEEDNGKVKTPHAGKLKAMRGTLLREITERHINRVSELIELETDDLLPLGTPDYSDHIAFCV